MSSLNHEMMQYVIEMLPKIPTYAWGGIYVKCIKESINIHPNLLNAFRREYNLRSNSRRLLRGYIGSVKIAEDVYNSDLFEICVRHFSNVEIINNKNVLIGLMKSPNKNNEKCYVRYISNKFRNLNANERSIIYSYVDSAYRDEFIRMINIDN